MENKPKLFNRDLNLVLVSMFLLFTGFYLLMPIIAMYVIDTFKTSTTTAGIVVSVYIITALFARPFSGYLVDRFDRRKFFILSVGTFALLFSGYVIAGSIAALIVTRVLLGATFSLITTSGNTLAIDLMPSTRRNEGIGYMGALTVISMAIGPMLGVYLIEVTSYNFLFWFAFGTAMLGFVFASFVKAKSRKPVINEPLSLDRFMVVKGIPIALVIMLIYFPYGTLMTYVALYVRECNLDVNSGNYYLFLATGIIVARIAAARLLNRGLHNMIILSGTTLVIIALLIFIFYINSVTFIISSLLFGIGFGCLSPSIQSMIIDLVPHNRRGSANSTFFIALDLGSGAGMLFGGIIANSYNYQTSYIVGLSLAVVSLLTYCLYARKQYYTSSRRKRK